MTCARSNCCDVEIGRGAILFEEIVDSRAFALVCEHFAFLEERVRRHNGVVVKTIGDAALAAAIDIQDEVEIFNASKEFAAIELKIGIHE